MDGKIWRQALRAALEAYPLPPRLLALLEGVPLERLVFDPVPVQARRDGWTPARQFAFILRLALCSDVARSARAVGMSRESAWRLRGGRARKASPPPGPGEDCNTAFNRAIAALGAETPLE